MSNTYVIGDVHGEANKLTNLLQKLNITSSDTVIFLGDYVDRGPDSYQVIEQLLDLEKKCNCIFIAGNHDISFFDGTLFGELLDEESMKKLGRHKYMLWDQGAKETYESYIKAGVQPEVHLSFYKKLLPYYILDNNKDRRLFIHGGYNRHLPIEQQKNNDIFWWDRDLIMSAYSYNNMNGKRYKFKNKDAFIKIYVGHTPVNYWGFSEPQYWGNVWNLDTGCGKIQEANLYALNIYTEELIKSD